MSPIEDDDSALETLLATDPAPQDGDAFTAAVMHRVWAEASLHDAGAALTELQRRNAPSANARRCTVVGSGAGALLAVSVAVMWPAPSTLVLDAAQLLALAAACTIGAWVLAAHALDGHT